MSIPPFVIWLAPEVLVVLGYFFMNLGGYFKTK